MKPLSSKTILVGGLHLGGDGYPNARNTLHILQKQLHMQTVECGKWLPDSMHLWRLAKARPTTKIAALCTLFSGNLRSVFQVIRKQGTTRIPTYIPYPAVFFLWWISWIPQRWRPRCIADAYISVWDSMYRDRNDGGSLSLTAKLLKQFEARALRSAQLVLVDTVANKQMFIDEFGLKKESVIALPLAIDDDLFLGFNVNEPTKNAPLTIFFVGTLIPLHGITTVLKTARLLMPDPRFRFCLIGDGQEAHLIEHAIAELDTERFTWIKEWVDLHQIAAKMCQADICLGVFGGEGKACRVLPFKVYMYLAGGRAVVTQSAFSLPESIPPPPILTVNPENAQEVADVIIRLADSAALRSKLGKDAQAYYVQHLGRKRIADVWHCLLADLTSDDLPAG